MIWFIADKKSDKLKILQKSEEVAQQCSVKMTFCKMSIEKHLWCSLFWKSSEPTWCNCTHSDMFYKIGLFQNFGKTSGKRLCWSFFLIKLYTTRPITLLKRDFSWDLLLWILRNRFKQLFYRIPPASISHFNQPS